MAGDIVRLDRTWVQRAFLVSDKDLNEATKRNNTWSDASLKYVDTTVGGNIAINPPPQFTRFCDVPLPSKTSNRQGIGPYYSEAIDDTSQVVHFRMGIARFNSLADFYSSAYNADAARAASTSRLNDAFFTIGKVGTFIISVMSFKLLAVRAVAEGFRLMAGAPKSRYYYLSPSMPIYWSAVTSILNQLTVNRGITPRVGTVPGNDADAQKYTFGEKDLAELHSKMPDIFNKKGGIDVFAIANKAKRAERAMQKKLEAYIESMPYSKNNNVSMVDFVRKFEEENKNISVGQGRGFHGYLNSWYGTDQANTAGDTLDPSTTKEAETATGIYAGYQKFKEFLRAEADDGGMFASFRVSYTGSVSESFSNSVGESEIQGKLNSMISSARQVNFSIAGGNITEGIGKAVDAVKSMLQGGLSEIGLGGLAAIGGAAFIDMPKVWQSSIANMPRSNYSIKLNSPYGNPISQLINIYLPLSMLLAMALPKSTGKQSYTSPFLIEYYDKGRAQSRLGMIDSMSITRGTSSLGFNKDGHALAIDVNFSIVDMSSVMHMPISMGLSPMTELWDAVKRGVLGAAVAGPAGGIIGALSSSLTSGFFDDSTVYSDYLAVLAGLGVNDQIYGTRKLKLELTKKMLNWQSWASISNMASHLGDAAYPGRLMSIAYKGIDF